MNLETYRLQKQCLLRSLWLFYQNWTGLFMHIGTSFTFPKCHPFKHENDVTYAISCCISLPPVQSDEQASMVDHNVARSSNFGAQGQHLVCVTCSYMSTTAFLVWMFTLLGLGELFAFPGTNILKWNGKLLFKMENFLHYQLDHVIQTFIKSDVSL